MSDHAEKQRAFYNNIPAELKEKPRWVCYNLMPGKDTEKPQKRPFNPITGKGAKSNDPTTWATYQVALDAMEMYGFSGLGFMFTKEDGFVGVDIDHCYNPETGAFNDTATAILAKQATYAEFSPSGDGVHLWFKGEKPEGASKNSTTGVEMYDSVRYFTVTGNILPGAPRGITAGDEAQRALGWIHENYVSRKKKKKGTQGTGKSARAAVGEPVKLTDEELLEKAASARDGEDFTALFEGNWQGKFSSQSDADFAFCKKLAFWSGKDREQMDRLFRKSGLFREKWDKSHHADGSTYGQETISRAIEATEAIYMPADLSPIFEKNGRYYREKGDTVYALTNFVFRPVEMLRSDYETQMTADLVTMRGETFRMKFLTTEFANQQRFKNLINQNTIALSYFGTDGDLELLKTYVYNLDWEKKDGVKAVGVYDHGGRMVFVSDEGSFEAGGELVDDIVQLEKHRSIRTTIMSTDILAKEKLPDVGRMLMNYNEPAKTISVLAWAAACFVKTHFRISGIKMPMLSLIGEAGSGKSTTLEWVILPIFSTSRILASSQVTLFTLMKEAASSNTIPLALDEFKPSKMDKNRLGHLYNHFRDSYDMHEGIRGRADLKVETYELTAPLIIAGEESAEESAVRERSIELLFSKKDLKDRSRREVFNKVFHSREDLGDFGRSILDTALTLRPERIKEWHDEGGRQFSAELPSRVVNNLACCYVGLKLLDTVCIRYGYAWESVFPFQFDPCVKYLEYAARNYLLDGSSHNQSILEETFEVMARMGLDPKNDYLISPDGKSLFIRINHIYDRYTKYRKDFAIVGETLTYPQFRKQLLHSDLLIQANVQKKINGKNHRCFQIDFETLKDRCDVSGFEVTEEIQPM